MKKEADWSGVIARLGVRTTDGRVLVPPTDEEWAFKRMPVPLTVQLPMLQDVPLSGLGVVVGSVTSLAIVERELQASGVLDLSGLSDELVDVLTSGDGVEAGMFLADCLAEAQDEEGVALAGWVIGGVSIGPTYRSPWADPCKIMIKLQEGDS